MRNPLKISRLIGNDPTRPTIAERAAALKDSLSRVVRRDQAGAAPSRRTVMGGALAAAVPLPVLAASAVLPLPDPDAELLAAGERYERALSAEVVTGAAYDAAWEPMRVLLSACPPDLIVAWSDRMSILGGMCWPTKVGGNLRPLPPTDGSYREAWTGEVLRNAIRLAVPRLGRGGQTPHHVRRWKALLPRVDALDADARAIDAATGLPACRRAHRAAQDEVREAAHALRAFTAHTPAGLVFIVRLAALDTGRGCFPSPNLLASAANVAGVDLSTVPAPRPGTY